MNAQTPVSASHTSIYAALAAAQAEMGPALKDSTNPAFRSKYADLANVCAAALPALNRHGIAVIQPPYDDENGNRFVKTVFVHASGETLECRVPLIVGKNDMQGYGSAVTYARRYGLMAMAGIAPDDDDGNAAAAAAPKDEPRKVAQKQPAPPDADAIATASEYLTGSETLAELKTRWSNMTDVMREIPELVAAKDNRKNALTEKEQDA